jgi:hypothetical protein
MKLIASSAVESCPNSTNDSQFITLTNDSDPREQALAGVTRIDLHFPKFTDGRAFSQAFLLSRRLGFKGEIRSGFTSAVLRADQPLDVAQRVLVAYPGFDVGAYQGDAVHVRPHFVEVA